MVRYALSCYNLTELCRYDFVCFGGSKPPPYGERERIAKSPPRDGVEQISCLSLRERWHAERDGEGMPPSEREVARGA